jgi:hypothetical protein
MSCRYLLSTSGHASPEAVNASTEAARASSERRAPWTKTSRSGQSSRSATAVMLNCAAEDGLGGMAKPRERASELLEAAHVVVEELTGGGVAAGVHGWCSSEGQAPNQAPVAHFPAGLSRG